MEKHYEEYLKNMWYCFVTCSMLEKRENKRKWKEMEGKKVKEEKKEKKDVKGCRCKLWLQSLSVKKEQGKEKKQVRRRKKRTKRKKRPGTNLRIIIQVISS